MHDLGKLQPYSIGIVAVNKALSSKNIEVTPMEHVNMVDGDISDHITTRKSKGKDASGAQYSSDIDTTVTVLAHWLPIGSSNRVTAPDVRRGELVMLYRFADVDEFWWTTFKDDLALRKLETVIYAFSGTTKEDTKHDGSNTYFLEISTHRKIIHLHTSNANGEPYTYDIQINTGAGFIQIQDNDGNFFKFDSKERHLSMVNRDGSVIEMNKKIINFTSTDSINLKSRDITQTSTNNIMQATSVKQNASNIAINADSIVTNATSIAVV